jgi:probable phosphoglycerate mutase
MTTHGCSSETKTGKGKQMTQPHTVLHLVRHGESMWNLAGQVQGQSQEAGSLTAAGQAQAERTARRLAERYPRAEAILTSDLRRARDTAEIIAGVLGLPVDQDAELREQRLGDLEGRRFAESFGDGTVQDVIDGLWRYPDRRPTGGESITELYRRVHQSLARCAAQNPGGELILVTHGGPVRVATAPSDPILGGAVPRRPVANAAIVTVTLSNFVNAESA